MAFSITNRETKKQKIFTSKRLARNYLLAEYRAIYGDESYRELLTYEITLEELAAAAACDIILVEG